MGATPRTRTLERHEFGIRSYLGYPDPPRYYTTAWETMQDVIGDKGGNHSMFSTKETREGALVNGDKDPWISFTDYPGAITVSDFWWEYPDLNRFSESNTALWTRMLAQTAPDRPVVLLPEFVAELLPMVSRRTIRGVGLGLFSEERGRHTKRNGQPWDFTSVTTAFDKKFPEHDVPGMFKDRAQKLANDYLSYQFGAAPFVSDLNKMLSFPAEANKRLKEIEAAFKNGSRKKWTKGTGEYRDVWTNVDQLVFIEVGLRADVTVINECKRWSYIKWTPIPSRLLPRADSDWVNAIMGVDALGLTLSAWELVPWSFLIDYFVNVGDFIHATGNLLSWNVEGGTCLLQKTESSHPAAKFSWTEPGPDGRTFSVAISPGRTTRKRMHRWVEFPMPGFAWSGSQLNQAQLSNLIALVAGKS